MSPSKLLIALAVVVVTGAAVAGLAVAGSGPGGKGQASRQLSLTVSPATGGKHVRFVVAFTSQRATGVFGKTRRDYVVEAYSARPADSCVINRDTYISGRPAGTRIRASLDPARGEGGPEGWCRGAFRGTVKYSEGFACPAKGRCRPPKGFPPDRTRLVARFSFRVR
jgi:hypothetical protein